MSKNYILLLETATDSCSAAICAGTDLIAEKYTAAPKEQAALLAPFIKDLLLENSIKMEDIAAVAVSSGPGSYTGLRVGVSCAKGICLGTDKPLIAVNTLAAIARSALDNGQTGGGSKDFYIVPMIDARRMEVYTALFDSEGKQLTKTESLILDEHSFEKEMGEKTILFTGNGAEKFSRLVKSDRAVFAKQSPHASGMRIIANEKFSEKKFEDCAYFEPFYLKDFVAGKPKKIIDELLFKDSGRKNDK